MLYTAVIGQTDPLLPIGTSLPAVCFTDSETLTCPGWRMVRVPVSPDPIRAARRLKILAHETWPDAQGSIWMDASFSWRMPPEKLPMRGLLAMRHPQRRSIQQEGAEILRLRLARAECISAQLAAYAEAGFRSTILTGTGLLVRQHTPAMTAFNCAWWEAFCAAGHTRDQMSVDYAAWVSRTPIGYLRGHYRQNPYVVFHKHRLPHPPDAHL